MLQRAMAWIVRSYFRGPGRSWVYTSLAFWLIRLVRRVTGRRPVVETITVGAGDTFTVDQLEISHRRQMKEARRQRRADRRLAKRS